MKINKFEFPKRKYKHNELPVFVIDETNKTIFMALLLLVFGIIFAIKMRSLDIVLIVAVLDIIYFITFYYFFYRHFIYDNLLLYDGIITYYDDTDNTSRKVIKQLANRYIRKLYTVETIELPGQDSFTLKTFIKGVKLRNDMKVRLFVLPDSFIKNRDGSFNVITIYTDILETPKKRKGKN